MPTRVGQLTQTGTLSDTVLALAAGGLDGCMLFESQGALRSVFLRAGRVVAVESSLENDSLEWLLFAAGILTEEAHGRVRSRIAAGGRRGPALVEEGGIAAALLCEWTERRARYLAGDLLAQHGQTCRFEEGMQPAAGAILVDLDPTSLVLDALRASRPGSREETPIDPDTVFRAVPDREMLKAALLPHEAYVLSLVDGTRTVSALAELSELGAQATCRCLAILEGSRCLARRCDGEGREAAAAGPDRKRGNSPQPDGDLVAVLNLPRIGPGEPWGAELTSRLRAGIRLYNDLYVTLCGYLVMELGPIAEQLLEKNLREVREQHAAIFARVGVARDGSLSEDALLRNLNQMRDPSRAEQLLAGLAAYLGAMIQAVKRILGAEHEQRVLRRLSEVRCGRT